MARFWWVNHKQTHRQEISGGYLWSPKTERNGARSQFYDNLRLAAPGDFIVSMAKGTVAYVGCVSDYALHAPKPTEFGNLGKHWLNEGWLLPMVWAQLPNPVIPRNCITKISPLLRDRYAPVQRSNGHGNQKAYLSEIDEDLFTVIADEACLSHPALNELVQRTRAAGGDDVVRTFEEQIVANIDGDANLLATEKVDLKKSRRGQGTFRRNLLELQGICRVTGIQNVGLLIASHIKPWRSCTTSFERLDGYNGLLLAPHVDFLFDKGFISFENSGEILVSTKLHANDLVKFGFPLTPIHSRLAFDKNYTVYLEHHRQNVFLK